MKVLICISILVVITFGNYALAEKLVDPENIKLPDELDSVIETVRPKQEVCVSGRVVCEDDPERARNVLLKLWDIDKWNPDDVMAESRTNDEGMFDFCGKARDPLNDIEPVMKIYHKCQHNGECFRKFRFPIPSSKIGGKYEFEDDINLGPKGKSEGEKCLQKESLLDRFFTFGKKLIDMVTTLMKTFGESK